MVAIIDMLLADYFRLHIFSHYFEPMLIVFRRMIFARVRSSTRHFRRPAIISAEAAFRRFFSRQRFSFHFQAG